MTKPIYKWKFLRQAPRRKTIKSEHGTEKWKLDEWQSTAGNIEACKNGYHCSDGILQAFIYVQGEVLAKVEVRGDSDIQEDKSAWREMRMVKAYKWTKMDSVAFSIYVAEQVIKNFEKVYPDDSRPRDAIKAAKAYLADPSKKNQVAANLAARSADSAAYLAYLAADSAYLAAYSAAYLANLAAYSAAYLANLAARSAYSAARSAYSADSAMRAKLERWLVRHVKTMTEITK